MSQITSPRILSLLLTLSACSGASDDDPRTAAATVQLYAYETTPTSTRPLSFCVFAVPNCGSPARLEDLCSLERISVETTTSMGASAIGLFEKSGPIVACGPVQEAVERVQLNVARPGLAWVEGTLRSCGDWTVGAYFTPNNDGRPPASGAWWVRSTTVAFTPSQCGYVFSNVLEENTLPADTVGYSGAWSVQGTDISRDTPAGWDPWAQQPIPKARFWCPGS